MEGDTLERIERDEVVLCRDSNNDSIKSCIKHIHPVLCLNPKDLLTISHINVRMLHRWGDCDTEHHSRNTEGDADSVEETSLAFLVHF